MNSATRLNSELIRTLLRRDDRKQTYLCRILDCSDSHIDRLLAGRAIPSGDALKRLASAFGITMEELLVPVESQRTA